MDLRALARELRDKIEGDVLFDDASRALYAADASNYRQVPHGVIRPRHEKDAEKALEICRRHGVPVLSRGAGTSLAGQCCNVAVIFDFQRYMNRILEIDPVKKTARVQPGVVLDQLRAALKPHGLTFGPDPATHNRCTFGGMIGNNACGVHSVTSGKTSDNIEELEILTYNGLRFSAGACSEEEMEAILREGGQRAAIYGGLKKLSEKYGALVRSRYPKLPRRVSGYNLDELLPERGFHVARSLVGTEGTCVLVLQATLRLVPDPPGRCLLVAGFDDIYAAADHVPVILHHNPAGLEGLDHNFVSNMRSAGLHLPELGMLPQGQGWLMVEFGAATAQEAAEAAEKLRAALETSKTLQGIKIFSSAGDQKKIWAVRESSFGATVFVPDVPDTFSGFEDSAVPPEKLGSYMRALQKLYDKYNYYAVTYGHFGDGCIHSRISFDLKTDGGIRKYRNFMEEAADLVVAYGGSFSGEHGDGQTWGEFLPEMYGEELMGAFREFKKIWDPENRMNPGKVLPGYRLDENLRLKAYAAIQQPALHFSFHQENGNFARTTERCIGVGKCLKKDEGVMCPSYMATNDEMHSTRGRAHLLHEMMRGEVVKGGWRDPQVKESLDLCLACKACKTECPVGVDMATYKAEFLAQYYKGRLRPLSLYAFGFLPWLARLASAAAPLVNFLTRAPLISGILKSMAGIAPEKEIPVFAEKTFKAWFHSRKSKASGSAGKVLLWPDTFHNYFHPEAAIAAVEVLEHAGFEVALPGRSFCCGRPLYDSGMLGQARRFLADILNGLHSEIEAGTPVICLEPSCASVFKDELKSFFPSDPLALKLSSQVFLLAEFLSGKPLKTAVKFPGRAVLHGHCHQKALAGMSHEERILSSLGADYELLQSGCCGMAGSFGFQKQHQDVSLKVAEQGFLPSLRRARPGSFYIMDGFSCREQARQHLGLKTNHFAEYLRKLIKG